VHRFLQERAYGRLLEAEIKRFQPDVVLSSNAPLEVQRCALQGAHAVGAKFVFWLQDIHGIAIERLIGPRFYGMGRLIGQYYTALEKRLLRKSDAVVSITEDFGPMLRAWGVLADRIHVIPNWASMDELPQRPKDNPWSRAHGLDRKFCFVYTGTIGLKHNPELLLKLGERYREDPSVAVVVVSEGAKADWLKVEKVRRGLDNLLVLPFQPYTDVPDVMGTADVLVAVLDPDAGAFSVPSKVLAYHCAGRPLLLSVPTDNLSARIVAQTGSGIVVDPNDVDAFLRSAEALRADAETRRLMAEQGLRYARLTFDLERIADRFESVLDSLLSPNNGAQRLVNERA
jgi:glycosyltransferase involved in cell wall biosynthesis